MSLLMFTAVLAGCGASETDFSDVQIDTSGKRDSLLAATDRGPIAAGDVKVGGFTADSGFNVYSLSGSHGRIRLQSPDVRVFMRVIDAAGAFHDLPGSTQTPSMATWVGDGNATVIATTYQDMLAARTGGPPTDVGQYSLTVAAVASSATAPSGPTCGFNDGPCCESKDGWACNGTQGCDLSTRMCTISCFAAGTPIATPNGPVAIEKIRLRDKVMSFDLDAQKTVIGEVTRTWVTADRPVSTLKLSDGTRLVVTGEHPFYLPARHQYVPARELKPGDVLSKLSRVLVASRLPVAPATQVVVESNTPAGTRDVYNFSVKKYVNYFAGGVLVHNY